MKNIKDKLFLVTGATGFIGANLVRRLSDMGAKNIHILTRATSDRWRIKDILIDRVHDHCVDIRHFSKLQRVIMAIKPQVIFHCATYGGYPRQKQDERIIETNVHGLINLLKALSDVPYESFINAGSSSEYGIKKGPMKEDDVLCPVDIYGVSKAAATIFANQVALKEKKPITTIRPFSVFGPYEDAGRLVTSVIQSCLTGKEVIIRSPLSVRDYVYIDDAVDFFLKVASKKASLGILNLAAGKQRTVTEILEIIQKISGKNMKIRLARSKKTDLEPNPWIADMTKAKEVLGWKEGSSFEEGIQKTIDWMNNNMQSFTI